MPPGDQTFVDSDVKSKSKKKKDDPEPSQRGLSQQDTNFQIIIVTLALIYQLSDVVVHKQIADQTQSDHERDGDQQRQRYRPAETETQITRETQITTETP